MRMTTLWAAGLLLLMDTAQSAEWEVDYGDFFQALAQSEGQRQPVDTQIPESEFNFTPTLTLDNGSPLDPDIRGGPVLNEDLFSGHIQIGRKVGQQLTLYHGAEQPPSGEWDGLIRITIHVQGIGEVTGGTGVRLRYPSGSTRSYPVAREFQLNPDGAADLFAHIQAAAFKPHTGQQEAEFGGAPAHILNVVTKSSFRRNDSDEFVLDIELIARNFATFFVIAARENGLIAPNNTVTIYQAGSDRRHVLNANTNNLLPPGEYELKIGAGVRYGDCGKSSTPPAYDRKTGYEFGRLSCQFGTEFERGEDRFTRFTAEPGKVITVLRDVL